MSKPNNLFKLPKWVQRLLASKDERIDELIDQVNRMNNAHAVLTDRNWFTISGPTFEPDGEVRQLFSLNRDGAHSICSLRRKDVLLVGRYRDPNAT